MVFKGEGPNLRKVSMKSLISVTNSGASAEEIQRALRRSASMPLNASSLPRNLALFSAE